MNAKQAIMSVAVIAALIASACVLAESDADGITATYYEYTVQGTEYYEVEVVLDNEAVSNVLGATVTDSNGKLLKEQIGLFIQQGKTTGSLFLDAPLADGVYNVTAGEYATTFTVAPGDISLEVSPAQVTLTVGEQFHLEDLEITVTGLDDYTITYAMQDNAYVDFNTETLSLTAVAAGEAVLYVGLDGVDLIPCEVTFYVTEEPIVGEPITFTWVNYDGNVLYTVEGNAGAEYPEYAGETPVKPADEEYKYVFTGFDEGVVDVEGNVTFTAQFKAVPVDQKVAKIGDVEYATVEEAYAAAVTGDVVEVFADAYWTSIELKDGVLLMIDSGVTVNGIILNGQNSVTVTDLVAGSGNLYIQIGSVAFYGYVEGGEIAVNGGEMSVPTDRALYIESGDVVLSGNIVDADIYVGGDASVTVGPAGLNLVNSKIVFVSSEASLTLDNDVTLENSTIDADVSDDAKVADGVVISVKPSEVDQQSAVIGVKKADGSDLTIKDLQVTVDSLDEIVDGAILEVDGEKFTVFKRVSNGRTYIVAANATAEFEKIQRVGAIELYHITANAFPLTVKLGDAEPTTDVILNSVNFDFTQDVKDGKETAWIINADNTKGTNVSKDGIYYPNGYGNALIYTLSITKQDAIATVGGGDITTGTITLGPNLYIRGVEIQPYMFDFRGHMDDAGEHDYDYLRHCEDLAITAEGVPLVDDASGTWAWEYSDYIQLIEETHVTVREGWSSLLDNYYLDPVIPVLKDEPENNFGYSYLSVTVNAKENSGYTGSFTFFVGLKAWDEAITQFEDDIDGLDDNFRDQWFVFQDYYEAPMNAWDGQPWHTVVEMDDEATYLTQYLEASKQIADKSQLGDASEIVAEFSQKVANVLSSEYYLGQDFELSDANTYAQQYVDYGYGVDYYTGATYKFYAEGLPVGHSMDEASDAIAAATDVRGNIEGYYVMAPFPHVFINVSFNSPEIVGDTLVYPGEPAEPKKVDYEQFLATRGAIIPGYVFVKQSWFTDEQDFSAYLGQPMPEQQPVVDMLQYFTSENEADDNFVLIAYAYYVPGDSNVTPEYYLYRAVYASLVDDEDLSYETVGQFNIITGDITMITVAYEDINEDDVVADMNAFFSCVYYDSIASGVITKIIFNFEQFTYDPEVDLWIVDDGDASLADRYIEFCNRGLDLEPQFQLDVWKNQHAVDFVYDVGLGQPAPTPEVGISENYTATVVEFNDAIYIAFIAADGKNIPAGEYTVIVSYLEYDDWADAMVVMEQRVTVVLDDAVANGSTVPVEVPAIDGIYAYTAEFTLDGDTVRGKTVLA